jgi:UDP-glucose 4-epimerase
MNNILITGGAGFIGTQISRELISIGYNVFVVDKIDPIISVPDVTYFTCDYLYYIKNTSLSFDTIIHLAAEHIVPQSLVSPNIYYENNVIKMKLMLDCMVEKKIKNIIFSSTGNVYGRQGSNIPLIEDLYYDPINPYAATKMAGESLIRSYADAYGLSYIIFRYFNAAGADPLARNGYMQSPGTHVIPTLCESINNNSTFNIFGNDYNSSDGTCVRDYVHIQDIAYAHRKALLILTHRKQNEIINLGGGSNGISVLDLIKLTNKITGKKPKIKILSKRIGDPPILIADITKAKRILYWEPAFSINQIINHAYNWSVKGI